MYARRLKQQAVTGSENHLHVCIIGGNIKKYKKPKVISSKNSKKSTCIIERRLYYLICILCAQEDSNKKQQLVLKIIYICIIGKQIHKYNIFSLCA